MDSYYVLDFHNILTQSGVILDEETEAQYG